MPLNPNASVGSNIRELHTGKTYAHTSAKFGKARANKQAIAIALSVARRAGKKKALGGPNLGMESMVLRGSSRMLGREGMISGNTPGRFDNTPMRVKAGSYVIPSDIPSALGQGNSNSGGVILKKMFSSAPYGLPLMKSAGRSGAMRPMRFQQQMMPKRLPGTFAKGGGTDEHVPIVAAAGEFLVDPEVVRDIGHGSLAKGHRVLDAFVLRVRKEHAETLKKLPPPKK